jgi:uncharacterized protein
MAIPIAKRVPGTVAVTVTALLLCSITPLAGEQVAQYGRRIIEPFDYRGVSLNDGPLLRQVQEVRACYLRVPNDDYLKGFRQRAGKPAPGADLGGWYTPGTFHVFGQVLSGLARMYAATGDEACRDKLNALIREWSLCIESDGYFYSTKPPSPPHYIYEKMVGGLLDAYHYGGNREALAHLDRITGWAEKNLDHSNPYVFNTLAGITEWYTLSENLYRAYLLTAQPRYRDYAQTWEYSNYWNLFTQPGADIFRASPGYHAYSHVNTLSGAAAAYAVTGQRRYLDIIRNAYDYLQAHQVYATGGYGPAERLVPDPLLVEYLDTLENHWETQCSCWAAFKLAKYLISFTGDARYGDWVERLVINGLGASLPMSADGRVMYYAGHGLSGACKTYNMPPWACCAGTRIQAVADYHDLIFFKDQSSLYVNLFTPATVTWMHGKTSIVWRQETRFPEKDRVTMRLSLSRSDRFAVKLRQPAWLASPMEASVNGLAVKLNADAQHWLTLQRKWHDGDEITLRLPMRLTAERFPAASTNHFPAAVVYGPVVLACRSPQGNPVSAIDFSKLDASLKPAGGEPLTFRVSSSSDALFRPYYQFKERERYFIYFDPNRAWTRVPLGRLKFSTGWALNLTEDMEITTKTGATVEHTFTGKGVRWVGRKFDDAGKCEVSIDGTTVATVDQYDPVRDVPFRYECRDLPLGQHTIRLTLLEEKHPASKDRYANITGFDVLSPFTKDPTPKLAPEADTNHDGKLSQEEAQAYRQKLAQSRKDSAITRKPALPSATYANVSYGSHERNRLDLWIAKSDKATPLMVYIHGGGFVGGDKSTASPEILRRSLNSGVSFMAINYRFRKHAPVQDILRDAARAVQFVRLNAAKYSLDPKRVASYGGSAGAGTSLWLAVHDDLADPKSKDPVLRQSSRIVAAGCINGQATYDLVEWEKLIGKFKPEWRSGLDEDFKFYHFKSHEEFDTPAGQKVLDDCSMLRQITRDDAPIFMTCSLPGGEPSSRNHLLHHPRHMDAVKQRCDEVGVEVHIVSTAGKDQPKGAGQKEMVDFLLQKLGADPKS